ncbi:Amino acid transporter [Macleaya cordata]|uniref:Amino acid transporter n=1 Tax=Macleaya cordata TaxID=56857 RepID=A0A200QJY8_MACCD|nr:Amino acid transporter [Macleaya cordata]
MAKQEATVVPLLEPNNSLTGTGTASSLQTIGNIIVSVVGTGVLGLPFAFRIAGWLAGSLGVIVAGLSTFYCMNLLVQCRNRLEKDESSSEEQVRTYGDLGYKAFGRAGRFLTETLILISQCGGSVAYLIFIGQNLSSIFKTHNISPSLFIILLIPMEIALSWIQSLSSLAPFSVFADICNVLAMAIVVKEDLQLFDGFSKREAVTSDGIGGGLVFAGGVAVFCFEGFGMTLALERSMREKKRFRWVLGQAFVGITLVYVCFGLFGYLAYGDETRDIVTLNLPNDWSATAVKIGLCLGLAFTLPIVVHPIHEIVEVKLKESKWFQKLCYSEQEGVGGHVERERYGLYLCRGIEVVGLGVLALCVPGFGVFVSLVGSTVCALLSFVLPALFHLIFMGSSLAFWQRALDITILVCGLVFAVYGTYTAVVSGFK